MFAVFCQLIPLNPTHCTFKCLNLLGFLHWIFLHRKKKKRLFFSAGLEDICASLKNLFFMVENIFLGKLVSFFSLARDEPKKLNSGSWTLIFFYFSLSPYLSISVSLSLAHSTCLTAVLLTFLLQRQCCDFRRPPGLAASILRRRVAARAASDWRAADPRE